MDVRKLAFPDFHLKHLLRITVQISPYSEGSLSVSKNDVEEADDSIRLPFLLSFFFHIVLNHFLGEVLKVESKVVLHRPGNNVSFDYILEPVLLYLLVNKSNMPHVQATKMDEFSELP